MTPPPSSIVSLASGVVRAWTRLYTWRMPPDQRERRRAEIESDLWESQQDAAHSTHAAHVMLATQLLLRLLKGMPQDLLWRAEQVNAIHTRRGRAVFLSATAGIVAALVFTALWLIPLLMPPTLPQPRHAALPFIRTLPPPPPPPPPPCRPPELSGNCSR